MALVISGCLVLALWCSVNPWIKRNTILNSDKHRALETIETHFKSKENGIIDIWQIKDLMKHAELLNFKRKNNETNENYLRRFLHWLDSDYADKVDLRNANKWKD